MKTILALSAPAEVVSDCLVAVVLDRGEKDKPDVFVDSNDAAVKDAAKDVISSGEAGGKMFETTLLHSPAKLKAKRLLLLGGGKAKSFSSSDLRKLAGAAVRALKSKSIREFAFIAPNSLPADEAARSIVEGAFVGNFDPDYYKSDRKDQKIDTLTVVASGDKSQNRRRPQSRTHRWRVSKFHSRPRQRALESHDSHDPRRTRQKDGAGSRSEMRSLRRRQN